MIPEQLFGLATGMGSLPHGTVEEALAIVLKYFQALPHWPQLPRRGTAEGLVAQNLAPLLQRGLVAFTPNGSPYFDQDSPGWEERCLQFYELLLAVDTDGTGLEGFAFPADAAAGFYAFADHPEQLPSSARCVKGQLVGPVSLGFQVTDPQKKPCFYNPSLREILVKTLAAHARWQTERLRGTGLPALVFVDDPGLYSYGSSSAVGLGRAEIESALAEIVAAIHGAGGLAGVHCCAGTDWSLLLELPLDVVSFDAYGYFPSMQVYAEALGSFLKRGGALAWGIVPTSEKVLQEDAGTLQRLLAREMETLARQGVDETLLRRQLLITPSCGTGTLTPELAERIYRLTASLAESLQK